MQRVYVSKKARCGNQSGKKNICLGFVFKKGLTTSEGKQISQTTTTLDWEKGGMCKHLGFPHAMNDGDG